MATLPFGYSLRLQDHKCMGTLPPFNVVPCNHRNFHDIWVTGQLWPSTLQWTYSLQTMQKVLTLFYSKTGSILHACIKKSAIIERTSMKYLSTRYDNIFAPVYNGNWTIGEHNSQVPTIEATWRGVNVGIGSEVNGQRPYLHGMLFLWLQGLGSTRIN